MVDAGGENKIYIPLTPGLELEEHLIKVAFTCLERIGEQSNGTSTRTSMMSTTHCGSRVHVQLGKPV